MNNLWGIDLGGTKVEGAVLKSSTDPQVLFRDRLPTEGHKGYDHVLGQIKKVVEKMEASMGYKPKKLGIATPGTIDPASGLLKNCNSTNLNGKPIKADLEKLLGIELAMANDANCFALAEANMGAVHQKFPNAKVVFGVIMGTGVGGGVVVDGKVINGLHGIGGEWGHNFLDESGGPCYCGKSGCVEKVLAGPALEKYYASVSGVTKSMKDVYDGYKAGTDPFATQTIDRMNHFFGVALSVVINILDPDVVVIGGGVGNIDSIYTDGVNSLRRHIFNNKLDTPVLKPNLGDSAGVFGAAFLVNN
ncbi:MAG: ROK family protein [Cytophagales bacterium]|nr:ROK family protein [Cytophagales bacterium]